MYVYYLVRNFIAYSVTIEGIRLKYRTFNSDIMLEVVNYRFFEKLNLHILYCRVRYSTFALDNNSPPSYQVASNNVTSGV